MSDLKIVRQKDYCIDFANEYGDLFVSAKWDGCCHIYRYYNGATYNNESPFDLDDGPDYIHICDLREFIAFLTKIADVAEKTPGFAGYETGL